MEDIDLSLFVPNVHFEQIPIKNLVSSQTYQRDLSQTHISKAVENFNLYQINPVKVSRRDGINYVFNGQHTVEIVAAASGSRETPVWCMIYDDLSYTHEADIFANQQKFVKPLTPFEVFTANLEAQNPDQLMVKSVIESFGLEIGAKKASGMICAISTVENIYVKYGYHVLNRVLLLLVGTWEGDPVSLSANFLNAVTRLVISYGAKLNDLQFKEKVGNFTPKAISRTAKERSGGSLGYAETMVLLYNGKKKSDAFKLPLRKLYGKESSIFDVLEEEDDSSEPDDAITDDDDFEDGDGEPEENDAESGDPAEGFPPMDY